jgi:filamentous hemagglutinin family protein
MDLSRYRVLMLSGAALASVGAGFAVAGPNGGTVVGGKATIQGQGTGAVTINQATQNAIINWSTFNIGKGETTTFNQPNSASNALNRVIGGQGPSFLDGTLTANGHVFIVNRDGVLFGSNAVINTAGFLATTSDIRNDDFMAGKYNFNIPGLPSASIVNLGTITATSGGFAALVAPGVRNSGTITATLGTVSLAAGNAFTLDFYGSPPRPRGQWSTRSSTLPG